MLGCREGVCVEGWCWVVGYGGERKIKTILILVPYVTLDNRWG